MPKTTSGLSTSRGRMAMEVGPSGVRVLGLWVAGVPETLTVTGINTVNSEMQVDEAALQGVLAHLSPRWPCSWPPIGPSA